MACQESVHNSEFLYGLPKVKQTSGFHPDPMPKHSLGEFQSLLAAFTHPLQELQLIGSPLLSSIVNKQARKEEQPFQNNDRIASFAPQERECILAGVHVLHGEVPNAFQSQLVGKAKKLQVAKRTGDGFLHGVALARPPFEA